MKTKNKYIYIIIISIVLILYYFQIINIPCLFREITHFYCPGCGISRALRSLIHLDLYQAFRYNNLIIILLPIIIIYYLEKILNYFNIKNLNITKFMNNTFWIILLVIVISYGILRNIPMFSYLIPTKI